VADHSGRWCGELLLGAEETSFSTMAILVQLSIEMTELGSGKRNKSDMHRISFIEHQQRGSDGYNNWKRNIQSKYKKRSATIVGKAQILFNPSRRTFTHLPPPISCDGYPCTNIRRVHLYLNIHYDDNRPTPSQDGAGRWRY
jgi:hypothetical protein